MTSDSAMLVLEQMALHKSEWVHGSFCNSTSLLYESIQTNSSADEVTWGWWPPPEVAFPLKGCGFAFFTVLKIE